MTEDEIIATLFAPLAGAGGFGLKDDAAVLSPNSDQEVVTTVDALVAGVHFFPDDAAESIAVKALGVNLSDLAAKAAVPAGFLLALSIPAGCSADWLRRFAGALGDAAARHGCPLLGGDTVHTPGPLTLSITAFGLVRRGRMLPRTGLRPGDRLYVSGSIGDAALGLALRLSEAGSLGAAMQEGLSATNQSTLLDRYLHPQARLALVPALRAHATAGMDVSDGLVGDLRKMLRASGLGATVDLRSLPFSAAARAAIRLDDRAWQTALTGGDDYEVIAGVPADGMAGFEAAAATAGVAVACIGAANGGSTEVTFLDRDGKPASFPAEAFQHFPLGVSQ